MALNLTSIQQLQQICGRVGFKCDWDIETGGVTITNQNGVKILYIFADQITRYDAMQVVKIAIHTTKAGVINYVGNRT